MCYYDCDFFEFWPWCTYTPFFDGRCCLWYEPEGMVTRRFTKQPNAECTFFKRNKATCECYVKNDCQVTDWDMRTLSAAVT